MVEENSVKKVEVPNDKIINKEPHIKKIKKIKKEKKNSIKIIIFTLIIVIMFAIIYFSAENQLQPENNTYNGFEFFKDNSNLWNTFLNIRGIDYQMAFNYHPNEVLNTYVDPRIENRIFTLDAKDNLVLAIDENASSTAVVAASQLSRLHKLRFLFVPINGAIYDDNFNLTAHLQDPNKNNTIFTTNCDLSSNSFVVMRFKLGNETNIKFYEDNVNCIHVTAQEPEEFRMLIDKLTYQLLDIIKE